MLNRVCAPAFRPWQHPVSLADRIQGGVSDAVARGVGRHWRAFQAWLEAADQVCAGDPLPRRGVSGPSSPVSPVIAPRASHPAHIHVARAPTRQSPQPTHVGEKRAARGGKGSDACATCGGKYGAEGEPEDTLWVGCDTCDRWHHGACVGATQARPLGACCDSAITLAEAEAGDDWQMDTGVCRACCVLAAPAVTGWVGWRRSCWTRWATTTGSAPNARPPGALLVSHIRANLNACCAHCSHCAIIRSFMCPGSFVRCLPLSVAQQVHTSAAMPL